MDYLESELPIEELSFPILPDASDDESLLPEKRNGKDQTLVLINK